MIKINDRVSTPYGLGTVVNVLVDRITVQHDTHDGFHGRKPLVMWRSNVWPAPVSLTRTCAFGAGWGYECDGEVRRVVMGRYDGPLSPRREVLPLTACEEHMFELMEGMSAHWHVNRSSYQFIAHRERRNA